ncbi:MgtC/SapB family protein [Marinactinospora thermotolerans]|uniref:Putative Mg2+ transporter-C (MgtC) family protein n=1 Tax=Marinactinospora thermotolerans DSM 45154 TaxID=1122192 RepID=A0A1T4KEZ4_9ACTN|nr:MgtC/SapB family protein [Marinactinospora thermotolerans]SJZ40937.1 putative Mg2+ transporter-C (MgtC) family protein [Marinactinospora thermotolerans DSM 45154]
MTVAAVQTNLLDFTGQGWPQLVALSAALILCSLIGLERELRQKSAGLRTHTLVGLGAALFMLVSKYGFGDILNGTTIMLDPSRVAAQIVSGIGFIGGGLIFVRRDMVRGLTTAAAVWVSAAVGTACGAGLWVIATFVTLAHFVVTYGYPVLLRLLTRSVPKTSTLRIGYEDGRGVLRSILSLATRRGFTIQQVDTNRRGDDGWPGGPAIDLVLRVRGRGDANELAVELSETEGVLRVGVGVAPEDEGE